MRETFFFPSIRRAWNVVALFWAHFRLPRSICCVCAFLYPSDVLKLPDFNCSTRLFLQLPAVMESQHWECLRTVGGLQRPQVA